MQFGIIIHPLQIPSVSIQIVFKIQFLRIKSIHYNNAPCYILGIRNASKSWHGKCKPLIQLKGDKFIDEN